MAQRLIRESILVVRDGKRIKPEIGKSFNLTQSEIDELNAVRPQAIAKVNGIEEDSRSTSDPENTDGKPTAQSEIDLSEIDLDLQDRATLLSIAESLGIKHAKNVSDDKLRELIRADGGSDEKL